MNKIQKSSNESFYILQQYPVRWIVERDGGSYLRSREGDKAARIIKSSFLKIFPIICKMDNTHIDNYLNIYHKQYIQSIKLYGNNTQFKWSLDCLISI